MRIDTHKHLCDIEVAAALVRGFVAGRSAADFHSDPLLRSGVERQLQIIGEAAAQLTASDPDVADHLPQRDHFIEVRDILQDPFAEVDENLAWIAATRELDLLADAASAQLEAEGAEEA